MRDDILRLREQGRTYNEIVAELNCSKGTVAWHCSPAVRAKYLAARRRNRKAGVVALKVAHGGKCSICGYDRALEALQFHHLDPKSKLRKFRKNGNVEGVTNLLRSRGKAVAIAEAKKCMLLCANCHIERHVAERAAS